MPFKLSWLPWIPRRPPPHGMRRFRTHPILAARVDGRLPVPTWSSALGARSESLMQLPEQESPDQKQRGGQTGIICHPPAHPQCPELLQRSLQALRDLQR